jgi:pyroglutamyl-peptidase
MKKILVTGFEPFDHDLINPSGQMLDFLQNSSSKHQLILKCLPVTFLDSFEILKEQVAANNPDIILLSGVAKNRRKISIEKVGINWVDARIPDNNGQKLTMQKIIPTGLDGIFSKLELEKMILNLHDSNMEISYSAGSYVCNYLYYKCLAEISTPSVFIHLPGSLEFTGDKSAMPNHEIFNSIFNFIELSF